MTVDRRKFRYAAASLCGIALLVLLRGPGKVIHVEWMASCLLLLPLLGWLIYRKRNQQGSSAAVLPVDRVPAILCVCAFLFMFSSAVWHKHFYFSLWAPKSEETVWIADYGIIWWVLLTMGFTALGAVRQEWLPKLMPAALMGSIAWCLISLQMETGMKPIYSDDHPSFMFRIWIFAQTFPQQWNYNPLWNAGVVDFVGVSSGANGVALLSMPLLHGDNIASVYTLIIGLLFIVLMPLLSVWALFMCGLRRSIPWVGGLFALGVSKHFFLWLLHFGTVGASLSVAFLLPTLCALFRIMWLGRTGYRDVLGLVVSLAFLCAWPPGALMAAPFLISLCLCRRWTLHKFKTLAVAGLVVGLLYIRTLWLLLFADTELMSFVTHSDHAEHGPGADLSMTKGFELLGAHLVEAHPLLIFAGVGGVLFLRQKALRRWWIPGVVGLLFLAGWGEQLLPRLQLSRMAIPLLFIVVAPAAVLTGRILDRGRSALLKGALVALLVMGGWNVGRIYANGGSVPYKTWPPQVDQVIESINEHCPENTRVLFAGKTVHTYGRGHVALLPVLTGKEMIACDYYHFPPEQVEYEMPPAAWKTNPQKTREFIDHWNAGLILTRHDDWKAFFDSRENDFELVQQFSDKAVYRVKNPAGPFEVGSGEIDAELNRISVKMDDGVSEAVIRYQWHPRLSVSSGATIYPVEKGPGVTLIGIRSEGTQEVTIRFKSWM